MPPFSSAMELRSNKTWFRDMPEEQLHSLWGNLSMKQNPATGFPQRHTKYQRLGSGSQAKVESWKPKGSSSVIVVKTFKETTYTAPQEAEILKLLPPHRSIITMIGYVPKSASVDGDALIFESCPVGDLFDVDIMISQEGQLAHHEAFIWAIYGQLADALAFLHEGVGRPDSTRSTRWRPIVHRDIKKENIFVKSMGIERDFSSIKIKLGDFGLATYYNPRHARMPPLWGTADMWPPEQTWEKPDGRPAGDVWAIGSIVNELVHGFPPTVDPIVTRQLGLGGTSMHAPGAVYCSYWATKSPRRPLPINVDPRQHEFDRRRTATARYSDRLNACMMAALEMDVKKRATAGNLLTMVEMEYGGYIADAIMAMETS